MSSYKLDVKLKMDKVDGPCAFTTDQYLKISFAVPVWDIVYVPGTSDIIHRVYSYY